MLFTINTGLLIAWTIVDPLTWERFEIDGQDWNTYGSCVGGTAATVFVSLIAAVNLVALLLACFQAYKARNISDEFSESNYIGIAIYGWLQTALIGVPILFLINSDNPTAKYFLQVGLIFVISMSMMSIVFVPAFVNFKKRSSMSTNRVSITGIDLTNVSQSGDLRMVEANVNSLRQGSHQSRRVQFGLMDSINEDPKLGSFHLSEDAESAMVDGAVVNRQQMMNQPIDLRDSSMSEKAQQMMATVDADPDSDLNGDGSFQAIVPQDDGSTDGEAASKSGTFQLSENAENAVVDSTAVLVDSTILNRQQRMDQPIDLEDSSMSEKVQNGVVAMEANPESDSHSDDSFQANVPPECGPTDGEAGQ